VDVRFLGHATALVSMGGVRVLTDPFLRPRLGPLERHGPLPEVRDVENVDVVVISHGHPDHFDPASLAAIPGRPLVIVPRGLAALARHAVAGDVLELAAEESATVGALTVRAFPARHWIAPRAPRAQPIGYLLEGDVVVYFAGDTGRFDDMRSLRNAVDLALLPVWTWGPHRGPGHLGPRSAAQVLADIAAPAAVPIHWGTLYPRRLHRVWDRPLVEPGDRFAAHAAVTAPNADVRVLRPGDATTIQIARRT
jgi:L-ascorbate metabolism protein UlaG (beta-lactamase superfamily)